MNVKRFMKDLVKKPKYKLHISNDYEHVHIYLLAGRKYMYDETLNINVFRALGKGAIIASIMSNQAKATLINEYTRGMMNNE